MYSQLNNIVVLGNLQEEAPSPPVGGSTLDQFTTNGKAEIAGNHHIKSMTVGGDGFVMFGEGMVLLI